MEMNSTSQDALFLDWFEEADTNGDELISLNVRMRSGSRPHQQLLALPAGCTHPPLVPARAVRCPPGSQEYFAWVKREDSELKYFDMPCFHARDEDGDDALDLDEWRRVSASLAGGWACWWGGHEDERCERVQHDPGKLCPAFG